MVGDSQSVQRTPAQTIQNRTAPAFPAAQPRTDRPRIPGRFHALTHQDAQNVGTVVSGTLTVASSYAYVLFDSGATHSFVSSSYVMLHSLPIMPMNHDLCVSTLVGSDLVANSVSKMCPIRICDRELVADLILLDHYDFDVILGNGARCTPVILCAMRACRLLRQGCEAILASVVEVESNDVRIEDIPVVNEFVDVFPENLPDLTPDREVEFTVDLAPGTTPISKAPYQMAPVEMRELKEQLEKLLEKGFVRPSVSPWRAPILFVKKKDGSMRLCIDYR
ncbi:uncharacterized protein LOC143852462 [Tasmannia lanceolata]|uniref:uncharacterized protein LOC143852462 n=1 Tax=Tasmannia lanceolata TaxID=3420 RepID=UPI0040636A88